MITTVNTQPKDKYSYGNDFEFHVFDRKKEKMVSAIPILKCDKNTPINLGDGIKVYADNILLETAFPPYYSKGEMFDRLHTVFTRIQGCIGKRFELVPKAAYVYDGSELKHPKAQEAGCSVNFNAWDVVANPPVNFNGGLRSAGAHFHIGNETLKDFDNRIRAIRLMDVLVGVPSVIYNDEESERERRKLYGQSSEHRPTPFGLEYRPLSSGVLASREATELTHDLLNHALAQIESGKADKILASIKPNVIRKAIDTCDKKLAHNILKGVKLPSSLMKRIIKGYKRDFYKSWKI